MKQVLQYIDSGKTVVQESPKPLCKPGEVLIGNRASLISAGTERSVVELAKKSLIAKARERPEQVKRVLQKLRTEGPIETMRQVRTKLSLPMPLGYSSAGVVLEVGEGVKSFRVGDRVASNGAHAGLVAVPEKLVAAIPGIIPFEEACYAVVGSVALQAVRLSRAELGSCIAVIGLGLIGQLAVLLLQASGCKVVATDTDSRRLRIAVDAGAFVAPLDDFPHHVSEYTSRHGVDAVLIAASTRSNQPLDMAAMVARQKGVIVAVGAVKMEVPRREFYQKELQLVVSRSYGPGRYDPEYEKHGRDYPYAYVRWTEQRNIEAVLEQMSAGKLKVSDLTTHSFPIDDAAKAYELIETSAEPSLGVILQYPEDHKIRAQTSIQLSLRHAPVKGEIGVGVVGAGNFASMVMLPELKKLPGIRMVSVCSAGGISAASLGARFGAEKACTDFLDLLNDSAVHAVFIATQHHLHAEQLIAALKAGKHVFLEKPLALNRKQLESIEQTLEEQKAELPLWIVGFNRRFSPAAQRATEFILPSSLMYRFNAGPLPDDHWTSDPEIGGGRLISEACHALDLCSFFVKSQIVKVYAESSGQDTLITLKFQNGSIATVGYLVSGNKSFPKENIELFGSGKVAVIDDFQMLTLSRENKTKTHRLSRDKGHAAEFREFLKCLKTGGPPPIDYRYLLNVAAATLAVEESVKLRAPVDVRIY